MGSPSKAIDTIAAGRYFSAQLNEECPTICGISARAMINKYVLVEKPVTGFLKTITSKSKKSAAMEYTLKV